MRGRGDTHTGRLLVSRREAAALLSMSIDSFERHVQPQLRLVRCSAKLRLVPVAELQRWIDANAGRSLRD